MVGQVGSQGRLAVQDAEGGGGWLTALGLQYAEQGGEVLRRFEDFGIVLIGVRHPGVRLEEVGEARAFVHRGQQFVFTGLPLQDDGGFAGGRKYRVEVILVGAKVAGGDQLGNRYFLVNFPAEFMVAAPLDAAHVIGGRGGEGYQFGLKLRRQRVEHLPPLVAEVVALIDDQHLNPIEPLSTVALEVLEDGLVGNDGKGPGLVEISRYKVLIGTEIIAKALAPLLTDGEAWG